MSKVRFALVGCGSIAKKHAQLSHVAIRWTFCGNTISYDFLGAIIQLSDLRIFRDNKKIIPSKVIGEQTYFPFNQTGKE